MGNIKETRIKVRVEREVSVERVLIELNERSLVNSVGMAGHTVTIEKQTLRDAHDLIVHLLETRARREDLDDAKDANECIKPNCFGAWEGNLECDECPLEDECYVKHCKEISDDILLYVKSQVSENA